MSGSNILKHMDLGNPLRLVQKQSRCLNILDSCKIYQAAKRCQISRPLDMVTQALPPLNPACHDPSNVSIFQALERAVGSDRKKAVFNRNLANDFEDGRDDGLQGPVTNAIEFILSRFVDFWKIFESRKVECSVEWDRTMGHLVANVGVLMVGRKVEAEANLRVSLRFVVGLTHLHGSTYYATSGILERRRELRFRVLKVCK